MHLSLFTCWQRHDFLSVKILSLPGVCTQKLRVDRTPSGARYQVRHSGPGDLFCMFFGRKIKTGHMSPAQAVSLFSDLDKLGALHAINRSMPGAMDGYHVSVRLRRGGKTNRFHLSNLSWFKRDELDGYLTDLVHNLGKDTFSSP